MHSNDMNGRGSELAAILSKTAALVERWQDLADCHTAEFISAGLWDKVVPEELRLELEAAHPDHLLAVFCEQASHHYDHQKAVARNHATPPHNEHTCHCQEQLNYTEHCSENSNDAICCHGASDYPASSQNFEHFLKEARDVCNAFSTLTTSPEELFNRLKVHTKEGNAEPLSGVYTSDSEEVSLPLMSDKKQHEVRAMAAVVAQLADSLGPETAVVDLGAGKGYLGAAVARCGRPVLGLEVDDGNAKAAAHRVAKLHAAKGQSQKDTELQSDTEERKPTVSDWLRTVTVSVDADTNISQLVSANFALPPARLTLAGLHTCGDLAAAALRIFLRTPAARAACLVGCCYHLLSAPAAVLPDSRHGVSDCQSAAGFPLSQRLRRCVLGRNARMLAQQSLERSLADMQQVTVSVQGLHWRALLETLLPAAASGPAHRVGRLASRCKSFPEYARRAFTKLGFHDQPSADELTALAARHEPSLRQLRALALLRLALAPVLERLVLLDRAQLLHEQGISRWFLVQLFAPVVSPRCFALVALKEPDGLCHQYQSGETENQSQSG